MNSFICNNKDCKNLEKEVQVGKVTYVLREGILVPSKPLLCQECGSELMYFEKEGEKVDLSNIKMGKFRSMSLDDRKAMLKKRAELHDSKPIIKEQKEHKRQEAIRKYFEG